MENNQSPERKPIGEVLKQYKEMRDNGILPSPESVESIPLDKNIPTSTPTTQQPLNTDIPKAVSTFNKEEFENVMSKETDPDLMTSYEIVKLPSKGLFYKNGIDEVNVEYMTSKDEDLLTTPSLIDNGTVLDVLLRRKIKTKGVDIDNLLAGDRNAVILFLRSSSYGSEYTVQVTDPRNGKEFKSKVDLNKLRYKKIEELPDENGYFTVSLPMRKKTVKLRLLTSGEENLLFRQAEALKKEFNQEVSEYSTLKLKSHIVSIDDKTDRTYISKFVDAMPAMDALKIRRKILDVSPDVDMNYEFTTNDGYKFNALLSVGLDFFFPDI